MKNVKFYVAEGKVTKIVKEAWLCLREEEADKGCGVPDMSKTVAWRQDRDRDGSDEKGSGTRKHNRSESVVSSTKQTKRSSKNVEVHVLTERTEYREVRIERRRTQTSSRANDEESGITLKAGDMCCGAGGVSGGMEIAGFQITIGVDWWHPAAKTFARNWPHARTYEMDLSDFNVSGEVRRCRYCHVVHFSLPCQFFSPAHTTTEMNEQDWKNLATNLAVEETLKGMRPMYVTFENTSGLKEIPKHRQYYDILLKTLTDNGWNAVFKVEKLSDFSNPQKRRRLIIIASW